MPKIACLLFFFTTSNLIYAQDTTSVSLVFMGDIMGHDSQIAAAYDVASQSYNYNDVFAKVAPILKSHDFAIANLEVTLAGPPFKGYPQFSSPVELALACKANGINVLVNANNHACDRGGAGIAATIVALDSLGISHTGTFINQAARDSSNLLTLTKNNIKIGLLNYTYGTNGLPIPPPTIVNLIDRNSILNDLEQSKNAGLDKLIVILHWGQEYNSEPSSTQVDLANFLFANGVDIVIGSHPHVIQRIEYHPSKDGEKEKFIAYSLGNYVSNQRKPKQDGGLMVSINLSKTADSTFIQESGYFLTWVNKPIVNGRKTFEIVHAREEELTGFSGISSDLQEQMRLFISNSRVLLREENINVGEKDN